MKIKMLFGALLVLAAFPALGATCKISEYTSLATDLQGRELQVAMEPRVASQTVTYTASAQSAALNALTRFVRVICDAKAHYRFSTAGTNATASDPYLSPDTAEYFGVQPGQSMLIDFYDGTT